MKKTSNKDTEKSIYDIDINDVEGTFLGVGLILLIGIFAIAFGFGIVFLVGLVSK